MLIGSCSFSRVNNKSLLNIHHLSSGCYKETFNVVTLELAMLQFTPAAEEKDCFCEGQ